MCNKQLFIFLEGNDDERFFENVVKPLLQNRYSMIRFWKYSQQKQEKIGNFVKSINAMNADYIFARDLNSAPCITFKKGQITKKFNRLAEENIIIVAKEIESWYLGGLDEKTSKKLSIRKKIRFTDNITKEDFNRLIPKSMPRIEFMRKILDNYDIDIGKEKNNSFEYFLNKWVNGGNRV